MIFYSKWGFTQKTFHFTPLQDENEENDKKDIYKD